LPVLAGLPEPLALLEVGASAGLCLLPDFYAYDYGGALVAPEVQRLTSPVFTCAINAATPVPTRPPRVVWRAGLDLNPVDLADPAEVAWLEALVWPEQTDRLARLRAAIMIAAEQKPRLVKGDLRTDLTALAREAPKDATLVIFHTAVLAYISPAAEREEFARSVGSLCDCANTSPLSARARPRASRRRKSKTVAGGQGRAVVDRSADPVREKCPDPHGCPGRRDRGKHQGVGLDDAGAGGRGWRPDRGPRQDTRRPAARHRRDPGF
jgi:hypothetical protein